LFGYIRRSRDIHADHSGYLQPIMQHIAESQLDQIFFWLSSYFAILWNKLLIIARYRFFDSVKIKKKNQNPAGRPLEFEFELRKTLIKLCCGFNRHEKRIFELHVIHTLIRANQPLYPSSYSLSCFCKVNCSFTCLRHVIFQAKQIEAIFFERKCPSPRLSINGQGAI
jgi:hypothetical protein